ncbi:MULTISPECIES: thermosome subunit alpha [Methanobrevibacter]|uniref:thermosome subunit alpha n=1 Tax=Methanobrevibacter TaxID=2172 RepID=UPI0025E9F2AE|nr:MULTISPECIES: thermosome subunit alpha [Methanobrevibacter]MBS7258030.1 thermosome subunit [Methanobrevibacter sp.]MCI7428499.1 thermosome subunit [Methanobrevibacter sp.]MDD6776978.1 thermosome subunit alpha [Methanobacteriaceae archaeon]MDY3096303.1 thermosome subunit alpha [Methanobrevibacter sp.]
MANQPVFILPEGTERYSKRDALRMNITAAKVLAGIVRTTLGPKGMDKMLVNSLGDVTVTNDGATIMSEMDIAQPAARMLVETAKKQEEIVGDGTTSVVVIAGELLAKAEELLDDGIATSVVVKGFRNATDKAVELLEGIAVDADDKETLKKVAITAMSGKGSDYAKEHLADLVVEAALRIKEDGKSDIENINIQRVSGDSVEDSFLAEGIVIDKAPVSKAMPKDIEDAKIAIMKYPIELKEINTDTKIDITSPEQFESFLNNEEEMIKDLVDQVVASGANVLFCQKGIDDMAEHYLKKAGIMTYKRVKKSDIERIAKATGAKLVTDIEDLTADKLGSAGHVYLDKIFDHELTFIEECENPKASSIVLRGSTRYVTEQIARALDDALGVVAATIEEGKVLIGGGACEIDLIKQLREYGETVSGREQLAILKYAEALEVIPRTLIENAGLDTINLIADLKAAHEDSNLIGINVFDGKVVDMKEAGVIEPLRVKIQALQSAGAASEMILRIDDMIAARNALNSTGPDESGNDDSGMPPMPGMGGGMPPMM